MPQSFAYAQALPLLGAVVAFLFAALLILYIFRLLFGQRIRPPAGAAGRSRQRRMDVVDTFELGRDRQLVVVRRDNVEHLLLIGGPNDVLIEASIPRADIREQRPAPTPVPREREAEDAAEWPAPPSPAPAPGRMPGQEPPRRRPVEAGAEAHAQFGPQGATPLPPDLFAPAGAPPQRPAAPPPQRPPALPPEGQPQRPAPGAPPRGPAGGPPPQQPPRPASPPFLARTPRNVGGAPQTPPGAPPARPTAPPPQQGYGPREGAPSPAAPPREPPQQKPQPAPPAPESSDPLDSLEAEMARLLGRPDNEA